MNDLILDVQMYMKSTNQMKIGINTRKEGKSEGPSQANAYIKCIKIVMHIRYPWTWET